MTKQEQDDIIQSLKTISECAGNYTTDHRTLAQHTLIVLNALNKLFEQENLPPIKELWK